MVLPWAPPKRRCALLPHLRSSAGFDGTSAAAIPYIRDQLTGAYVDLLAAEALMVSSVRGIHQRPEELSVTSLITKIVVPELTGRVLRACADVLGARYYLREGFAEGVFQKMLRDHAVIQLFDGSSGVCLAALTAQLSTLAKGLWPRQPERMPKPDS